jgi:hypothetical protein
LVYVVLDEFPFTSAFEANPEDPYSWCLFKRPQICQRRDGLVRTIARTPPPAFLFPNQRCQRPDRLPPTPPITPGGGEERLSSRRLPGCQSVLSDFFRAAIPKNFGAKITVGRRGASLLKSATIRLRLGNLATGLEKIKGFFKPMTNSFKAAAPSEERRI